MVRFARIGSVISSFIILGLSAAAWADTYRWVDDNGVVNYAERAPRDVPADRVSRVASVDARVQAGTRSRASSPAATPQSNPAPQVARNASNPAPLNETQEQMLKGLQQAETDRLAQIAKIKQDNCDRSRRVLANLTSKERIRVRTDTGIERALPEDERQDRIAAAQRGIVENCDA